MYSINKITLQIKQLYIQGGKVMLWNSAKLFWTSDNQVCKMWFWIEIIETDTKIAQRINKWQITFRQARKTAKVDMSSLKVKFCF